jgi:hypothetical protein
MQDWKNHRVFCNPPYGKTMREWAKKCYGASQEGALVVLLAHARTDTRWFHGSTTKRMKYVLCVAV